MSPAVVLVGLPGSGKSSIGRRVARRVGLRFVDSDDLITGHTGRSIPDIFSQDGESAFRELEERLVADALATFGGVLALGGGAVLSAATRRRLRDGNTPVVLLATDVASALERTHHGMGRPLLAGDPEARLRQLAAERGPLYAEVATVTVVSGGRGLAETTDAVVAAIGTAVRAC